MQFLFLKKMQTDIFVSPVAGDAVTYLGFIGVLGTAFILIAVFRSYFKSPLRK
jgi:hypothetical protein